MNGTTKLLTCTLVSLVLMGCESSRDSVRKTGSRLGLIQIHDIRQADEYRKSLPEYLGLPSNRVSVEPGSGVTHIIIRDATEPGSKQILVKKVQEFADTNYFGPIKLRVLPEDGMIWDKPTLFSK